MAIGVNRDVLDFLPERRAAGLIFVKREDDAHGSGGQAGDGPAELDQLRNNDAVFRVGTAERECDTDENYG